jgi:hypothetical protein
MRQRNDDQDQQRNDREQRVVRDRAGEQQSLVRAECLQRLQYERARVLQNV